jgi:hypothetical protein
LFFLFVFRLREIFGADCRSPNAAAYGLPQVSSFSFNHSLIKDWYGTSRLLASCLIRIKAALESLMLIDVVFGFRFGNNG